MKKLMIICIAVLVLLSACSDKIPEPEQCALCAGLPCHAPCIINLSTGEMLELAVYEPHPFVVGELAEEQHGGTFSFVRGAGVEGYKLSAKSITITVPVKADKMEEIHFCNSCMDQLIDYAAHGYILVDIKDTQAPVFYTINADTKAAFRCYEITVQENKDDGKYEINIIGTLNDADYSGTN